MRVISTVACRDPCAQLATNSDASVCGIPLVRVTFPSALLKVQIAAASGAGAGVKAGAVGAAGATSAGPVATRGGGETVVASSASITRTEKLLAQMLT